MGNMRLLLELVANSNGLRNGLNTGRRDVHTFVTGARKQFEALKGAGNSLQGRLATLGIGVGAGKIVMETARLDKSLTQIGQTAGASASEVGTLRAELFRMGRASGQNIEDLKDGFNVLVQSGLNMKESRATLDGVNVAMAVTGANANTLAAGLTVAAQAFQFDLAKPGQALELLDKMVVAGRLGNAELENLSQIFARVGINAQAAGLDFNKTLGFIEALSKVERQPERLATLADSTLRVFTNMNYMKAAQQGTGVRFYDKTQKRRDPLLVLAEVKKKYDGLKTDLQRDSFVSAAFGKADLDTIKGIRTLLASNNLAEVGKATGLIKDASGTLKRDFGAATRNLVDQFGMLKNDIRKVADDMTKPMNETLGTFIQFLRDKKENGGLDMDGKDMLKTGGAIVATTWLLSNIGGKYLGNLANKKLVGTAAGVAEGKVLQMAVGVTPVFVVNADAIGGNVAADAGKVIKDTAATTGGAAAGGAAAAKAGMGALLAEWWKMANTPVAKGASYLPMLASRAGFVGAAAGGGYLVGWGLNKGMGAMVGHASNGRYKGDGWLGEMMFDLVHRQGAYAPDPGGRPPLKNDIRVEINFDEFGRTLIKTRDMNTTTSINSLPRGNFGTPVEQSVFGPGY